MWVRLDVFAHMHSRLVPRRVRAWICDRLDLAYGMTKEELGP